MPDKAKERARKLYKNLESVGYTQKELGTPDDFVKYISNSEGASSVYDLISKDTSFTNSYDIGDKDFFMSMVVPKKKEDGTNTSSFGDGESDATLQTDEVQTEQSQIQDTEPINQGVFDSFYSRIPLPRGRARQSARTNKPPTHQQVQQQVANAPVPVVPADTGVNPSESTSIKKVTPNVNIPSRDQRLEFTTEQSVNNIIQFNPKDAKSVIDVFRQAQNKTAAERYLSQITDNTEDITPDKLKAIEKERPNDFRALLRMSGMAPDEFPMNEIRGETIGGKHVEVPVSGLTDEQYAEVSNAINSTRSLRKVAPEIKAVTDIEQQARMALMGSGYDPDKLGDEDYEKFVIDDLTKKEQAEVKAALDKVSAVDALRRRYERGGIMTGGGVIAPNTTVLTTSGDESEALKVREKYQGWRDIIGRLKAIDAAKKGEKDIEKLGRIQWGVTNPSDLDALDKGRVRRTEGEQGSFLERQLGADNPIVVAGNAIRQGIGMVTGSSILKSMFESFKPKEGIGGTVLESRIARDGYNALLAAQPNVLSPKEAKDLTDVKEAIDINFPEERLSEIRQKIGAIIYKSHTLSPISQLNTVGNIEKAIKQLPLDDRKYLETLEESRNIPAMDFLVDKNRGMFIKDKIPTGSVIGRSVSEAINLVSPIANFTERLAGQRNDVDAGYDQLVETYQNRMLGESPFAQELEQLKKENEPTPEEKARVADLEKWVDPLNGVQKFVNGAVGLGAQIYLQGAFIRAIGTGIETAGAIAKMSDRFANIVNNSKKLTSAVDLYKKGHNADWLSGSILYYSMEYDRAAKEANDIFGVGNENVGAKTLYASIMSGIMGTTNGIFRDTRFLDAVHGRVAKDVLRVARGVSAGNMTKVMAEKSLKSIGNDLSLFAKEVGLEDLRQAFEMGFQIFSTGMVRTMFDSDNFTMADAAEEAKATFTSLAIEGLPMAMITAGRGSYKLNRPNAHLFNLVGRDKVFRDKVRAQVEAMHNDGRISDAKYNEKNLVINTLSEIADSDPAYQSVLGQLRVAEAEMAGLLRIGEKNWTQTDKDRAKSVNVKIKGLSDRLSKYLSARADASLAQKEINESGETEGRKQRVKNSNEVARQSLSPDFQVDENFNIVPKETNAQSEIQPQSQEPITESESGFYVKQGDDFIPIERLRQQERDIEQTSNALDNLPKDNEGSILGIPVSEEPLVKGKSIEWDTGNPKSISEAYHRAKREGTNPELVEAVDNLLTDKTQENAIQKQSTDEVDVQEQPQNGEEVGERNQQPQELTQKSETQKEQETLIAPEDNVTIDDVVGKPIIYNGKRAHIYKDGQTLVAKIEGENREYELGNVDEVSSLPISNFPIQQQESVVGSNSEGDFVVRGKTYKNNQSDPLTAITHNEDGDIVSVTLDTEGGQKRTFRGQVAEDLAYQIHLKEISKNNESRQEFERFVESDEQSKQEIISGENESAPAEKPSEDNGEVQRQPAERTAEQKVEPQPQGRMVETETEAKESEQEAQSEQKKKSEGLFDDILGVETTEQAEPKQAQSTEPVSEQPEVSTYVIPQGTDKAVIDHFNEVGNPKVNDVLEIGEGENKKTYTVKNVRDRKDGKGKIITTENNDNAKDVRSFRTETNEQTQRRTEDTKTEVSEPVQPETTTPEGQETERGVQQGTTETGRDRAEGTTAVLEGQEQSVAEKASHYKKQRQEGKKTYNQLYEEAKQNEPKGTAKRAVNYSYLSENGKAMQALKAVEKGESTVDANVPEIASKIGELKSLYPHLTEAHENELFDYMTKDKSNVPNADKLNSPDSAIGRAISVAKYEPKRPLDVDAFILKSDNRKEWEAKRDVLKSSVKDVNDKVKVDKKTGWTGLQSDYIKRIASRYKSGSEKQRLSRAENDFDKNLNGVKDRYEAELERTKLQLKVAEDLLAKHEITEQKIAEGEKALYNQTKEDVKLQHQDSSDNKIERMVEAIEALHKELGSEGLTIENVKEAIRQRIETAKKSGSKIANENLLNDPVIDIAFNEYTKRIEIADKDLSGQPIKNKLTTKLAKAVSDAFNKMFGKYTGNVFTVVKDSKALEDFINSRSGEAKFMAENNAILNDSDFIKDSNGKILGVKPEIKAEIEKEKAKIISEAKSNGTYMKAPNDKDSNLNENQWVTVRTKRFKDWFGDWEKDPENASKVVDGNKEPMVVYHGARSGESFNIFRGAQSFFSSDKNTAEAFRNEAAYFIVVNGERIPISGDEARGIADLVEPYETIEYASDFDLIRDEIVSRERLQEAFDSGEIQIGVNDAEIISSFVLEKADTEVIETFLNVKDPKIKDYKGKTWGETGAHIEADIDVKKDGFIANNIREGGLAAEMPDGSEFPIQTTFVVFHSNQIKSATENVDTFSPSNADIRYMIKDGTILGAVVEEVVKINGEDRIVPRVVLNGEHLNGNTAIHEAAGHVMMDWYEQNNKELYNEGIKLVRGSDYLKRISENEFYQQQALRMGEEGSAEYNTYLEKEALAMAIGDAGGRFTLESKKSKFGEWATNMWRRIKNYFGFDGLTPEQVSNMTLEEFANKAAAHILDPNATFTSHLEQINESPKENPTYGASITSTVEVAAEIARRYGLDPRDFKKRIKGDLQAKLLKEAVEALNEPHGLDLLLAKIYEGAAAEEGTEARRGILTMPHEQVMLGLAASETMQKIARDGYKTEDIDLLDRIRTAINITATPASDVLFARKSIYTGDAVIDALLRRRSYTLKSLSRAEIDNAVRFGEGQRALREKYTKLMEPAVRENMERQVNERVNKIREEAVKKARIGKAETESSDTPEATISTAKKAIQKIARMLNKPLSKWLMAQGNPTSAKLRGLNEEAGLQLKSIFESMVKDKRYSKWTNDEVAQHIADIMDDTFEKITARNVLDAVAGVYDERPTSLDLKERQVNINRAIAAIKELGGTISKRGGMKPQEKEFARLSKQKKDLLSERTKLTDELDSIEPNTEPDREKDIVKQISDNRKKTKALDENIAEIKQKLFPTQGEVSKAESKLSELFGLVDDPELSTSDLDKTSKRLSELKGEVDKALETNDYSIPFKPYEFKMFKSGREKKRETAAEVRTRFLRTQEMENELEFMKQNMQDAAALNKRDNSKILSILSVPRQLMASGDFSAIMRQGLVPVMGGLLSIDSRRRRTTKRAIADSFRKAFSEQAYNEWNYDLRHSSDFESIKESGLALTDIKNPDLTTQEEAFMGNVFDDLGRVGKGVNTILLGWSERHYSGFLNQMRVDLFRMYSDQLRQRGLTPENSPEMYKAMAGYVNSATGRGNLSGFFQKNATALNATLFAPRLIASRLNMLTYAGRLVFSKKFRNEIPKEVMKSYGADMFKTTLSGLITMWLMNKGAGLFLDDDEHSMGGFSGKNPMQDSDWGKVRIQDTRFDIWGGFQQYAVLSARVMAGIGKAYSGFVTGEKNELGFKESVSDPLGQFIRYKASPVAGMAIDVLSGETAIGESIRLKGGGDRQVGISKYLLEHFTPLSLGNLIWDSVWQDADVQSSMSTRIAGALGETIGQGTSTFHKTPKKQPKKLTEREMIRQQRNQRIKRRKEIRESRRRRKNNN